MPNLRDLINYRKLRNFSISQGASLFGVADIASFKNEFDLSGALKERVHRAVSLGVGLSRLILTEITAEPTKLYYHHYRTANMYLDRAAFAVAQWIEVRGFLSVPVAASQITDWQEQKAHLSHKKIAMLAGLGWIGRNNLLVSREFGAQLRLATVLTDMPLKVDAALEDACGACRACLAACPVGAIQEDASFFKHLDCFKLLQGFQKKNIVGQFICGICVNACLPRRARSRRVRKF